MKDSGFFKNDSFGIEINGRKSTNYEEYSEEEVLEEGQEITITLDDSMIKKDSFSKFIIEGDKNIIDIDKLKSHLERFDLSSDSVSEIFKDFKTIDIIINDSNDTIKSDSKQLISDVDNFDYFKINVDKNFFKSGNGYLKTDLQIELSNKYYRLADKNIITTLQSFDKSYHFEYISDLTDMLGYFYFIKEDISKKEISVKNQDTSDNNEYNNVEDENIPAKIKLYLTPEAFKDTVIHVSFDIEDLIKDGKKLKEEFKNKFKYESGFFVPYGSPKSDLIALITKIIPTITDADIKLDGKALPEDIKVGGVISISSEKIKDQFEDKNIESGETMQKNCTGSGSGDGGGSDDGKPQEKNCSSY